MADANTPNAGGDGANNTNNGDNAGGQNNQGGGADGGNAGGDDDKGGGDSGDGDGQKKNSTVPHEAFHAERERRKEAEAELQKIRGEQKQAEEKRLAEQGEFKQLAEQKTAELETVTAKLADATEKLKGFEEAANKHIEDSLSGIKVDSDRELAKDLLEGKDLVEKQKLLPSLLEKFGASANYNPKVDGKRANNQSQSKAEQLDALNEQMKKAKESRNTKEVLALSRQIKALENS